VEVVGNIKTLFTPPPKLELQFQRPIVVAGSTHRGEEELLFPAVDYRRFQLVVAPRHPERFKEVEGLAREFGKAHSLSVGLFSQGELDRDIVVVDKLGVLASLYREADRVFLGGSLVEGVGGHNPIEVAYFQKPLISGPYIFNQQALFQLVEGVQFAEGPAQLKKLLQSSTLPTTQIVGGANLEQILNFLTG
jgi:3-deoxy-D-manno-octulosonic-acid transferase